jgi:serine/threonine protein kinase/Tol biopolymer transport system component
VSLTPGTRLGSYEVLSAIGAGGMGQVYRAHDTKLDRGVAIKVLPELFATDADRLARFEREARTLAALNHPNIAQVFGLEHADGVRALVMELVTGDDLSVLIARGPIPLADALPIARQIADALEAAHEQGIIHRDLKPANVKVRADGTVKVLDFGLAKAMDPAGTSGAADAMNSPTLTARATQMGTILGTAAYMAPEQAKGKTVDKRADIWAFGVVLYEMLAGKRAFEGEDVSDTLAAVLTREPDFAALPPATPASVVSLLRHCLERDPKRRLRDIGDGKLELDAPASTTSSVTSGASTAAPGRGALWRLATAALAIALLVVSSLWWRSTQRDAATPVRTAVTLPPGVTMDFTLYPVVAVSRDGSRIAFVGIDGGIRRLYVRRLNEFEAKAIQGADGASSPFFSPDGAWIGFFADGQLKKVSSGGGPVIRLADASDNRGGVWADDDTIIYAPSASSPVYRIAAAGGSATPLSKIDETKKERTHRWPAQLPGGKTVLVTVGSVEHPDDYDDATIQAIRLDNGERRVVVQGGRMASYAATGHLLFVRGQVLYAVPFDVEGGVAGTSPVPVIDGVSGDVTTGSANYAVAGSGAVVFVPGDPRGSERRIAWVDRQGRVTPIDAAPAAYSDPHLSPDGRQIAVSIATSTSARDIYLVDAVRGTSRRMTLDGNSRTPLWSRDGRRLIYIAYDRTRNVSRIMSRSADGVGEPVELSEVAGQAYAEEIASDGALMLSANQSTAGTYFSVYRLQMQPGSKPVRLLSAPTGDMVQGAVSPDGRWLAYCSSESGRYEVYVEAFGSRGSRSQISTAGGIEPRWATDGRALFYTQATSMMMVPIEAGPAFNPGKARVLFTGAAPPSTDSGQTYAVPPTGDRFLMLRPSRENAAPPEIRLILNWFSELTSPPAGK